MYPLLKMKENRIRRNYTGGRILDSLRGVQLPEDSNKPEEWICSTVPAINAGQEFIAGEGISKTEDNFDFRQLLEKYSDYYLGKSDSNSLGFLVKWIDSQIRLHVQAHPTKSFSQKNLGLEYGKFECYYILAIRENVKQPYIRLGFQNPPKDKNEWKEIIQSQNIEAMNTCFSPIPVKPGDVVFIPGGIPHAIGEGLLLLEVMEPSDLVVRCEFNREGIIVPPQARYMGKNLDFCLDIFDYAKTSIQEVQERYFIQPILLSESDRFTHHQLIDSQISNSFEIQRLTVRKPCDFYTDERYAVAVCSAGKGIITCMNQTFSIQILDSFFIAYGRKQITIEPEDAGTLEICLILPK
jgi:mannose-6-phosphate isomerase